MTDDLCGHLLVRLSREGGVVMNKWVLHVYNLDLIHVLCGRHSTR